MTVREEAATAYRQALPALAASTVVATCCEAPNSGFAGTSTRSPIA
jgi:hypothetical protein